MKYQLFAGFVISALVMTSAIAGDIKKGKKVFRKCKACHYVEKVKNKTGPHLVNIVGRTAGSVDGFRYSKEMASSGLVWDEKTLTGFLSMPQKYIVGTKMAYAGLRKKSDIANVIAYLKSSN